MRIEHLESWVIVVTGGMFVMIAEVFFLQQFVVQGAVLYSVVLVLLLLYSTFRWPHPQHYLVVLAIPSVVRLLSYTLPIGGLSPTFAQLTIAAPVALTAVVYVWLLKQEGPRIYPDWRKTPYYILLIMTGMAMGLLLYQFQQPEPPLWTDPLLLLFHAFVLLVMAFIEEWLFRGIMQNALAQLWKQGFWAGLIVAYFYTAMSFTQGMGSSVALIFVFSLILGLIQHASDNLLNVFLVHGSINLTFFLILPLLGGGSL